MPCIMWLVVVFTVLAIPDKTIIDTGLCLCLQQTLRGRCDVDRYTCGILKVLVRVYMYVK